MAVSFTRFSLWTWGAKEKELAQNGNSSTNLATELGFGFWEPENLKFPFVQGKKGASPSRKVKRKWESREQRRNIDREFDFVLVPSDGVCLSCSEDSEDSDWSIGWLEPHGPELLSEDEDQDNSFAVLVPCYRPDSKALVEDSTKQFLSAIKNLPDEFASELLKPRAADAYPSCFSRIITFISQPFRIRVPILLHSYMKKSHGKISEVQHYDLGPMLADQSARISVVITSD